MLRTCESLLGKDPRTLGRDLRTFGGDPRILREGPQDPVDGEGPRSGGSFCNLLGGNLGCKLSGGEGETCIAGRLESKLSVVTWDCATLPGAAPGIREQKRRHAAKIDRIVSFACRHDVVMLQEAHGDGQGIGELASRIPTRSILGSFCRGSGSGGVLIIISDELRGRFASCRSEEIEKGGALLVTLEGGGFHPLASCCLHVVPEWSFNCKRNFFQSCRRLLAQCW